MKIVMQSLGIQRTGLTTMSEWSGYTARDQVANSVRNNTWSYDLMNFLGHLEYEKS